MKRSRSPAVATRQVDAARSGVGADFVVPSGSARIFREVPNASDATRLTDAVSLATPFSESLEGSRMKEPTTRGVLMPWMGFGTYKVAKDRVESVVLQALTAGYRCLDTAFIYGGETTEASVGRAIRTALDQRILENRASLFVITKHWRKYHGYERTLQCLELSLKRLQLEYVDLWLMHWPGPAWNTMNRRKDVLEQDRWHYAVHAEADIATVRAETWRAMEDSVRNGKCRAIGVSNFSVDHLKTLKKTATLWPPAVNQVEMHPLYPQTELLEYCKAEGIVVQAYASLGGQDMGKAAWKKLLGGSGFDKAPPGQSVGLLHAKPVTELARQLSGNGGPAVTPAQVLLRWGLERGCAMVPKASSQQRIEENAQVLTNPKIRLTKEQVEQLQSDLFDMVAAEHPDPNERPNLTRLCWRNDPLRMLDFA
jgi:diketogulonate reductase-like aldo/keto reductase